MGRLHLSSRLKSYTGSNANSRSTSPNGGASSRRINNNGSSSESSPDLTKVNGLMLKVNVIKVHKLPLYWQLVDCGRMLMVVDRLETLQQWTGMAHQTQ